MAKSVNNNDHQNIIISSYNYAVRDLQKLPLVNHVLYKIKSDVQNNFKNLAKENCSFEGFSLRNTVNFQNIFSKNLDEKILNGKIDAN